MTEIKSEFLSCKGKSDKKVLLENLEDIVVKLNERINQSSVTLQELKVAKDKAVEDFNEMLQKEKLHYNKIKVFEAECDKNNLLMTQIKAIKRENKNKEQQQYA